MHKETYEKRKKQTRKFKAEDVFSRKSVEAKLLATTPDHFRKFYPTPPDIPSGPANCASVSLLHSSLFVAG